MSFTMYFMTVYLPNLAKVNRAMRTGARELVEIQEALDSKLRRASTTDGDVD